MVTLKLLKHISELALFKKYRAFDLPFDLQIDLFNKKIKSILLHGCEIWGYGDCDVTERILKFYTHIFNLKKSTTSFMIYGELGIMPIIVDIKARIASFWSKLIAPIDGSKKLASGIYDIV